MLGVPLAPEKTQWPTTVLRFQGIGHLFFCLLQDKLLCLCDLILELHKNHKANLYDFQAVFGHLNFACWVVAPGWAFCSWLYAATRGIQVLHHFIRLTVELNKDIRCSGVWFSEPLWLQVDLQVYLDASDGAGMDL